MRVYKVVRRQRSGRLVSAFVAGKAEVVYKKDCWVEPPNWLKEKGYGILVFSKKKFARQWAQQIMRFIEINLEVWEAEALNTQYPKDILDFTSLADGIAVRWTSEWPIGTLMADRVKLLRKVWPDAGK